MEHFRVNSAAIKERHLKHQEEGQFMSSHMKKRNYSDLETTELLKCVKGMQLKQ
ncbi:hypothetical protein DPMN_130548 [Dreissena polymorpha]|uniref:Uncharacterized protein n=1 Tax=Dreissena polymorpha TaxID=45954 RepID=A0A9D4H5A4_DREPO|nr:hypothetical protein DPMN_130548 [Dreissena polymorpha]